LLAAADPKGPASHGMVNPLHFPPKAKRVIWLYQSGGPTHLETFDPKPQLAKLHGQPMPESFTKGQPIAQLQGAKLNCFGPQFAFKRFGKSGQEICELFPHLGSIADEMCIIRSMKTEAINHDPAHTFMNTGSTFSGRPAAGSWTLYGLGSENQDLPGFIVLTSTGRGGQMQPQALYLQLQALGDRIAQQIQPAALGGGDPDGHRLALAVALEPSRDRDLAEGKVDLAPGVVEHDLDLGRAAGLHAAAAAEDHVLHRLPAHRQRGLLAHRPQHRVGDV